MRSSAAVKACIGVFVVVAFALGAADLTAATEGAPPQPAFAFELDSVATRPAALRPSPRQPLITVTQIASDRGDVAVAPSATQATSHRERRAVAAALGGEGVGRAAIHRPTRAPPLARI